jgi:hypothetical protein
MLQWDISIPRIKRYGLILGVAGTLIAALAGGLRDGGSFAAGAAIAIMTIESWSRLATALNPEAPGTRPSVTGSAMFLAARYVIIGGAIFGFVKILGVTPVAMLLGLLVSFAAVLWELGQQASKR